jgi:hypothetical protein
MFTLLLTMIFNQRIEDFSTHQTPPARHPDLSTRSHVHKVINNHCALATCTLHPSNLLQHVVCIYPSVENEKTLNLRLKRKCLFENLQKRHISTKQYPENFHSLSRIVPVIHQDYPDEARTAFTHLSCSRKWEATLRSNRAPHGRNPA